MKLRYAFAMMFAVGALSTAPAHAANYTTDQITVEHGAITKKLKNKKGIAQSKTKRVEHDTSNGRVTLKMNQEGEYVSSGELVSKALKKKHFQYVESASVEVNADIPEGTSLQLYVRTIDQNENPGIHSNPRTWTKVSEGEEVNIGAFSYYIGGGPTLDFNKLRWKVVLKTEDPSVTPTLHSVIINYKNMTPRSQKLTLPDNTFGVNNTQGASVRVTLKGKKFVEGQEHVFVKNMYSASNVEYVNSKTLIATIPIEALSAGTYTIAVRNRETNRVYATDGYRVMRSYEDINRPQQRMILRGVAPVVHGLSRSRISYVSGGSFAIYGTSFAYGSTVHIDGLQLSDDAVSVISGEEIRVDVNASIAGQYQRGVPLGVTVVGPDLQEYNFVGLVVN